MGTTDGNNTERDYDKLYAPLHRSLLTGNLSGIAQRDNRFEYKVAGGGKFVLWPGSGLQKKNISRPKDIPKNIKTAVKNDTEKTGLPHWIMAAERLETSRKYLRTAAQIDVNWIEPLAEHLIQRVYLEPHWDSETGYVHAFEKVSLFGIVLVPKRRINFGPIAPLAARDIFIQSALVEGDLITQLDFFVHNQSLLAEANKVQDKLRQTDVVQPETKRYQFYQERIPEEVYDKRSLEKYAKEHSTQSWFMTFADLCTVSADASAFPDKIVPDKIVPDKVVSNKIPAFDIDYRYSPGDADDGLTVVVPQKEMRQLEPARLGWLVPGLLEQKITALLKSLPKEIRRQIVPIPDTAKEMIKKISFGDGELERQVCKEVTRLAGRIVVPTDFNTEQLPPELRMNVRVLDDDGNIVGEGKDFLSLRKEFSPAVPTAAELRKPEKEFYEAHKREIQAQVQHLPSSAQLKLYAKTLPNFDFYEEVGLLISSRAMTDRLTDREPPAAPPHRSPQRSTPCSTHCAPQGIVAAVQEVTKVIVPLLETYQQAKLNIERHKPHPAALEAEEHLLRLTVQGFLTSTDWKHIREYPRYFRAVPLRFEKLRSGGESADRHAREELEYYWQKYRERLKLHELADITDPELAVFRWMIEEYRISLFAQRLGTNVKVSPQRLDKQFALIKR